MAESLQAALKREGISVPLVYWNVVLPIGISFDTFQSMSHDIDDDRGDAGDRKVPGLRARLELQPALLRREPV